MGGADVFVDSGADVFVDSGADVFVDGGDNVFVFGDQVSRWARDIGGGRDPLLKREPLPCPQSTCRKGTALPVKRTKSNRKNSKRPVDALAVKTSITHLLTT